MANEDADHFSLRWNNFHSNLTSGFHSLLQSEDLVDVTLAAEGQLVQAHKIVLSVCSPYFKQLFKMNPCKHPIVILKDVSYNELVSILQFMYKGEVNVRQEELSAFLKTAETLQIKGLTGDEPSSEDHRSAQSREEIDPPRDRAVNRSFKRRVVPHSNRTPTSLNPTPVLRPASTKRPRIDKQIASNSTVPTLPKTQNDAIQFVEMQTPKPEPIDYDSDVEELDSKSEAIAQLLEGEVSLLHADDADSLQSHYDSPLLQVDSSQSHLDVRHSLGTSNPQLMDSSQPSLNNTLGIAGNSQMHDVSQDGSQGWSCPICVRDFTNKYNLGIHMRDKHTDRGPFICQECGKETKNRSSLRVHLYHHRKKEETYGTEYRIMEAE